MFALRVLGSAGCDDAIHPLGPQPVHLGRASTNHVVLDERTVSSRHLAAWVASGHVLVEDLRSRNGTFVNERRIEAVTRVDPGDVVRLGESVHLQVCRTSVRAERGIALAIEDTLRGRQHPLTTDRFRLGGDEADLTLEGAVGVLAVLMIHDSAEAWLCEGDYAREIAIDEPFEVFGRTYALRCTRCEAPQADMIRATSYPYRLACDRNASGAVTLHDPARRVAHRVRDPEAAVLLAHLGHARRDDRAAGMSSDDAGWVDDREVLHAIWGAEGATLPLSRLNALLVKLRRELRAAGLDPLFLEKRRGALRARVAEVEPVPPA